MPYKQVIICGAGPVGLLAANLLGMQGVETLIVEKRQEMYTYARAVGIDDEALRSLQAAGLLGPFEAHIERRPTIQYLSLNGYRCYSPDETRGPYGHPTLATFFQPRLEEILRNGLQRFPCVELVEGCELTSFAQSHGFVRVRLRHEGRESLSEARYLLACDGGRSRIRKQMGLRLSGHSRSKSWLVVDAKDSEALAEQIRKYHLPRSPRPMVTISLPGGMRRFECLLRPEEAKGGEPEENEVARLFEPLTGGFPIEVLRKKVYERYFRYAKTLQKGHVFLLGDAAHLVPPYGGQGLCSGLRDALNLSWKLGFSFRFDASPRVTASYATERSELMAGTVCFVKSVAALVENPPRWKRFVHRLVPGLEKVAGERASRVRAARSPTRCRKGLFLKGTPHAGDLLLQPDVVREDGAVVPLDELCGFRFALLFGAVEPDACLSEESRLFWQSIGAQLIRLDPADPRDGRWEAYFANHARILVVRPDKVIAAQCAPEELDRVTADLRALLFTSQ